MRKPFQFLKMELRFGFPKAEIRILNFLKEVYFKWGDFKTLKMTPKQFEECCSLPSDCTLFLPNIHGNDATFFFNVEIYKLHLSMLSI